MSDAHPTLAHLAALPENWDSHGGRPIDRDVLDLLALLLTEPAQPVPLSSGGVQLEWHNGMWDVEIELAGDGQGGVRIKSLFIGRAGGRGHASDG